MQLLASLRYRACHSSAYHKGCVSAASISAPPLLPNSPVQGASRAFKQRLGPGRHSGAHANHLSTIPRAAKAADWATAALASSSELQAALQQLEADIAAHGAKLGPNSQALLQKLEAAAAASAVPLEVPPAEELAGTWAPLETWEASSMTEIDKGRTVLSRVCWGLFQPADLPVQLGPSALVYGADGSFRIRLEFTAEFTPEAKAAASSSSKNPVAVRVDGLWETLGSAASAPEGPPNKEVITMTGGRLQPRNPEDPEQLSAWLALLQSHNAASMNSDDGTATSLLPQPMVASRDIVFYDGQLLVQRGKGSHGEVLTALQRIAG